MLKTHFRFFFNIQEEAKDKIYKTLCKKLMKAKKIKLILISETHDSNFL